MSSQLIDNRKIVDGVVGSSGLNTNIWYTREPNGSFTINGAFNGAESIFDWVLNKTSDSRLIKAGVIKIASAKKTLQINFDTSFPSTDYFVFFLQSNNVNSYWIDKKVNRFVIAASWELGQEVSWLAIHKNFARTTGTTNPGTIFSGTRNLQGNSPDLEVDSLNITNDNHANLTNWHNKEYIIKPNKFQDGIILEPDLNEYSIVLSTNININMFWVEKASDRFKISTSFKNNCIIDYLMIKKGIDWWNEF